MLVQLEARGFRNLAPIARAFETGSHLILGDTGAGKTSLLEAIYLLATTRSFRTSQLADCRRHGEEGFALLGEVEAAARQRLDLNWSKSGLRRTLNGSRSSLAEHLAVLPVICWTSNDREILTGPPEARRRFVDRGLVGLRPSSVTVFAHYREALAAKRQVLLTGGGELRVWNRVLAGAAAELIALRHAYVDRLAQALANVLAENDLGLPEITVHYRPSPAVASADELAAEFQSAAERELHAGRPLLGPHRDEVKIRWQGHEIRRVASAGERKLLGLSLLAAQGRVLEAADRRPIYLLDDVDTELDGRRLASIWSVFGSAEQIFATSNRAQIWQGIELEHRLECRVGEFT